MHDGCNHGSAETDNAPAAAPQGGPARRSAYWRSVEQLANTPEFQAYMHREFQPGAAEATEEERRTFIKMMGASFALAGLAAAGCRRFPEAKFAEYASRPANRTPGIPLGLRMRLPQIISGFFSLKSETNFSRSSGACCPSLSMVMSASKSRVAM